MRSEAEFQALLASLQGGDKQAKDPNMILGEYKPPPYLNNNGLVRKAPGGGLDPWLSLKERAIVMRWSKEEREIFYDKFVQHERHEERFAKIAHALSNVMGGRKKHGDVVQYYYKNKRTKEFTNEVRSRQRQRRLLKQQAQAASGGNKSARGKQPNQYTKKKGDSSKGDRPKQPNQYTKRNAAKAKEEEKARKANAARGDLSDGGDSSSRSAPSRRANKAHWTVAEEAILGSAFQRVLCRTWYEGRWS